MITYNDKNTPWSSVQTAPGHESVESNSEAKLFSVVAHGNYSNKVEPVFLQLYEVYS